MINCPFQKKKSNLFFLQKLFWVQFQQGFLKYPTAEKYWRENIHCWLLLYIKIMLRVIVLLLPLWASKFSASLTQKRLRTEIFQNPHKIKKYYRKTLNWITQIFCRPSSRPSIRKKIECAKKNRRCCILQLSFCTIKVLLWEGPNQYS